MSQRANNEAAPPIRGDQVTRPQSAPPAEAALRRDSQQGVPPVAKIREMFGPRNGEGPTDLTIAFNDKPKAKGSGSTATAGERSALSASSVPGAKLGVHRAGATETQTKSGIQKPAAAETLTGSTTLEQRQAALSGLLGRFTKGKASIPAAKGEKSAATPQDTAVAHEKKSVLAQSGKNSNDAGTQARDHSVGANNSRAFHYPYSDSKSEKQRDAYGPRTMAAKHKEATKSDLKALDHYVKDGKKIPIYSHETEVPFKEPQKWDPQTGILEEKFHEPFGIDDPASNYGGVLVGRETSRRVARHEETTIDGKPAKVVELTDMKGYRGYGSLGPFKGDRELKAVTMVQTNGPEGKQSYQQATVIEENIWGQQTAPVVRGKELMTNSEFEQRWKENNPRTLALKRMQKNVNFAETDPKKSRSQID